MVVPLGPQESSTIVNYEQAETFSFTMLMVDPYCVS